MRVLHSNSPCLEKGGGNRSLAQDTSLRMPGFINHKEPVAACWILDGDQARIYDLKSLMPLLYCVVTESDYMAQYRAAGSSRTQLGELCRNGADVVKVAELTATRWPGVVKGGRNCKAFQNAAYLLKNLGLLFEETRPILPQWNRGHRPPLPEWELRQALRNAHIYGSHPVEGKAAG